MWKEGGRLTEAGEREGSDNSVSEKACEGREKCLRREDILHSVPLVCVMVLKGCVLMPLTVMVVGVELNRPCQAGPVTYWAMKQKHTTLNSPDVGISQHIKPTQDIALLY